MKEKSLKVNFLFNFVFTLMNIIYPLITLPYVSRVLGAENLGKVNFASSFTTWLILIASVGIPTYGIREIARVREDKSKLSKVFSELMVIKFTTTVLIICIYVILVVTNKRFYSEITLYVVTGVNLVLNIVSMDWFYQGIEEYGYITMRSIMLKFISLVLMFFVVKSSHDYVFYAALSVLALSSENILNYLYSRKFVKLSFVNISLIYHIKKIKYFFLAGVVFSIYTQFDSVILGIFSSNSSVAYYTRTKQVINLGLIFSSALTQVMLPRVSYLFQKDRSQYKQYVEKSVDYVYIISIPLSAAVILLSHEIMLVLGGNEFIDAKYSLQITALVIFINSLGSLMYSQVLLPTGNESKSLNVHLITAVFSLGVGFLLVPKLHYIGSSVVYILSQFLGNSYGIYISKKIHNIKLIKKSFFKYLIATIIMSIAIIIIKDYLTNSISILFVSGLCGIGLYFITLVFLREHITKYVINLLSFKFKNSIVK